MAIPTVLEVLAYLENYGVDVYGAYTKTGNQNLSSPIITGIVTTGLKKYQPISGLGIPAGATIISIDSTSQITISTNATSSQIGNTYSVTYNTIISEDWIVSRLTNHIIPYIENTCGVSYTEDKTCIEVYSGTGKPEIILNHRNIKTVVLVELLTGTMNTQLNVSNLEIMRWEGVIRAKAYISFGTIAPYFPRGDNNIKVTYKTYQAGDDLKEVAVMLCCERILGQINSRTGGGSFSAESWSRTFGERGKYSDIRHDLARDARVIMQRYSSSVTGG